MPRRKILLAKGEIYHVFNRGVARMPIFTKPHEFLRFVEMIDYYHFNNTPVSFSIFKKRSIEQRKDIIQNLYEESSLQVEILAFCLMTNHYHFVLRQLTEYGISHFIANTQNGYGKYFNMKNDRIGPVFQPAFQAVRIETDEQLVHVVRYVHLNPSTGFLTSIENLPSYQWSSLPGYLDESKAYSFIDYKDVVALSGGNTGFRSFVFDQAGYQRELGVIKHLMQE